MPMMTKQNILRSINRVLLRPVGTQNKSKLQVVMIGLECLMFLLYSEEGRARSRQEKGPGVSGRNETA